MSKYIKKFETTSAATSASDMVSPNVSYVVDKDKILYIDCGDEKPVEIKVSGDTVIIQEKILDAAVGDWLFSDLTHSSEIGSKTPIGICVAPKSHFSDGKARYMSLVNMSLSDPENGTTATGNDSSNPGAGIRWGKTGDIPSLTNIAYSNSLVFDSSAVSEGNPWGMVEELHESNTSSYLASDFDFSIQDSQYPFVSNRWFWYQTMSGAADNLLPYMFNADGSRNTLCNQSGKSTGDLDGKTNTDTVMALQVASWQSGALSNDVSGDANYPAFCACRRFNAGVSSLSGQWYLPASGEAAYMWARINLFNTKLSTLGSSAVGIGMGNSQTFSTDSLGYDLWSSSEYSEFYAWGLYTDNGYLNDYYGKDDSSTNYRVRAFLAL